MVVMVVAMVMIVMVMVMAMVMVIVPEAIRQVGWLYQFPLNYSLLLAKASTNSEPSIGQSFHNLKSFPPVQSFCRKAALQSLIGKLETFRCFQSCPTVFN